MYSDEAAAALYDVLNPWGASDDFYLALAMSADRVLDVGCGTGTMLHRAIEAGHGGRLVGVDPDRAALTVARAYPGIEWRETTAASIPWVGEFDLAVMMSHAFQFLVTDEDVRSSLSAIARALVPGGRFVFETRNPHDRAWERWTTMDPFEVTDPAGRIVRVSYDVVSVEGDVVTIEEITSDADGHRLRADRARLRFLGVEELTRFLSAAGLLITETYGDWDRSQLERDSAEIIICAEVPVRRSSD